MSSVRGEVAVVLHTHLPWVANHGVWPVGEEWLFQAWGHSWLPVTRMLCDLAADGHRDVLTLGVTPMVAAQVGDDRLARDLGTWLGGQMWRAEEQRWHWWLSEEVQQLSHHHWGHHQRLLAFHEEVQAEGGLLALWARLEAAGVIELLGGPATHPYLPLVRDEATIDAQLEVGLRAHERWAGHRPSGIWVPEMGHRPGLEQAYERAGVEHVLVAEGDGEAVLLGDSSVTAFPRDTSVGERVWSPTDGYPGDAWYRDFHTQGTFGAHQSHRVTGHDVPWQDKEVYDPVAATTRVADHVDDLLGVLRDRVADRPLVVAAWDTELFGHWWYEGPAWLEGLLRAVQADPSLRTTTLRSRRERHPASRRQVVPRSTWGVGGDDATWSAPATAPVWEALAEVEARTHTVLRSDSPATAEVVEQLGRELAHLRCSDWPFMITRGNSPDYARERVAGHAAAAHRLLDMVATGTIDRAWLDVRAATVAAPVGADAFVRALLVDRAAGASASPRHDQLVERGTRTLSPS